MEANHDPLIFRTKRRGGRGIESPSRRTLSIGFPPLLGRPFCGVLSPPNAHHRHSFLPAHNSCSCRANNVSSRVPFLRRKGIHSSVHGDISLPSHHPPALAAPPSLSRQVPLPVPVPVPVPVPCPRTCYGCGLVLHAPRPARRGGTRRELWRQVHRLPSGRGECRRSLG